MKYLYKLFICVAVLCFVKCNEVEEVTVHLELLEMDLADYCSNLSAAERDILFKKPNAYKQKYEVKKKFAEFSKKESDDLKNMYHISNLDLPDGYKHRWKILEKMGDSELPNEDWLKLIRFEVETQKIQNELQLPCDKIPCDKLPCVKNTSEICRFTRSDISQMLLKSHDANYLREVWSAAQEDFLSKGKYYGDILKLIFKAAESNGFFSVETYWSSLVEHSEVYTKARVLWEQIEPFYKKLQEFIKLRLEQNYRITKNDTIPVYLLGSERGLDLTLIADKILPHRYLFDEINASLHHENIGGRKSYEMAEKLVINLGLKKVNSKFWLRSVFNGTCPSHCLLYCADKYSQVITCNKIGFSEYLDAHEDMTRAVLDQMDYSTSIYHKFRYSVIDEAISQLSSILAMKTLPMNGLLPEAVIMNEEKNHNQMTALLITALRIFPKLSYYFLADEFRLKEIENPSDNIVEKWWEYRQKYQMVNGVTNQEWDLLGDPYIESNKPYIGKFLGTILQFQILEHFEHNGEDHINILSRMAKDKSFKNLIRNRLSDNWLTVLDEEFGISDIDSSYMLQYFKPLEKYFENAPTQQVTQTLVSRTTTATPVRKPSTTQTTTPAPITTSVKTVSIIPKQNTQSKYTPKPPKIPVSEEVENSSQTHKAAWVGGLIGIFSLLIILAIVGQKKCRRPRSNNRRHNV